MSEAENIPTDPPSLAALDPAESVRNQARHLRLSNAEAAPAVTTINSPTVRLMTKLGIEAETIGMPRLASGAALVTHEKIIDLVKHVSELVCDCDDIELASMGSNAVASLAKAQASLIKSAGGMSAAPEKQSKGRKSFGKGERIGPIVDAKSS